MTLSDIRQWLYRGKRPNWMVRILNRACAAIFSSGVAPDHLVTLELTGRKSARTISLPVVVTTLDGQHNALHGRTRNARARNPTDIASGQIDLLALPATRAFRRNANGEVTIDSVDRNRKISLLRLEALRFVR